MKLSYVLLACTSAAIVSALPLQDTPLVTRNDVPADHHAGADHLAGANHPAGADHLAGADHHAGADHSLHPREIEEDDLFTREPDEELQARDIEQPDGLVQRDVNEPLERRFGPQWYHKWKADRDHIKAMEYKAKEERQRTILEQHRHHHHHDGPSTPGSTPGSPPGGSFGGDPSGSSFGGGPSGGNDAAPY